MSSARKILAVAALVLTWTLVPSSSAVAAGCPNEGTQAQLLSQAAIEDSLACLINQERTSRGIPPVYSNGSLRQAGLMHSSDMVSSGFFAHTTPSGVSFIDRIEATGYTRGVRSWVVGENLVWGVGLQSTPGAMVTAWMDSPPHRENLLRGRFREVGIAAVRGTPQGNSDPLGVTVSSEYGYRAGKGGKKKARKASVRRGRAMLRRCKAKVNRRHVSGKRRNRMLNRCKVKAKRRLARR